LLAVLPQVAYNIWMWLASIVDVQDFGKCMVLGFMNQLISEVYDEVVLFEKTVYIPQKTFKEIVV
jgi:hypothetical protein